MADTMEIIISAVDSASEVFQSIIGSAEDMADGIGGAVDGVSSDFDTIADNVSGFQDAVDSIDDSEIDALADSLGMSSDEVERLLDVGANLGSIPFNEASAEASELADEIQKVDEQMDELNNSAGDVMVAQTFREMSEGIAGSLQEMVDSAGSFQDSMDRASLEAEGFGVSADEMKSVISDLGDTTGRAGGQLRESFIKAAARGVTDMDSFKTMMEGAGAQAYLFGTDVQTMANSFSSLATKSSVYEKFLANMGITMDELGQAMGLTGATADEVKEKWKELDTNQRASALGMAASMNEGKDANNSYKNSWQRLQDQVDIAKGKLERMIGSVLLPVVIPAMQLASTILDGLGSAMDYVMNSPAAGLVSILGSLAGAFLIGVTAAGFLKQMMGFLRIEATLAAIETTALAIAEDVQAGSSLASAVANAVGASGFGTLAASAWAAATAVWAVIAPLLPFIAAAALVAIAIYEVGKSFGWWTDVGSMIEAIQAGLTRLWNAFINHPDVQATIKAIGDAWNWIVQGATNAWNAVMEFFGVSNESDFDIVRALIDGIGAAWEAIKVPIEFVIGLIQGIIGAGEAVSTYFSGFGATLGGIWTAISGIVGPIIGQIVGLVNNLIVVFTAFKNGQIDLPTTIVMVLNMLWNAYISVTTQISSLILSFAGKVLNYAVRAGRNFLNGVINQVKQVPGRMLSVLLGAVSAIVSAGNQWVSNAKSKAHSIVTGVGSTLSGVAGAVSTALGGVKDAIVKPFEDAYNTAKGWWDQIVSMASNTPSVAHGGEVTAYGGEVTAFDVTGEEFNISTGEYIVSTDNNKLEIDEDITLILDFKNLPSSVDPDSLIKALADKKVLSSLVNNRDYQSLNAKVNQKINSKIRRSNGG